MLKGRRQLAKRLAAVEALCGLPPSKLKQLADAMESVSFLRGDVIVKGGGGDGASEDAADALYVVLLGDVECRGKGPNPSAMHLGEGAVFGDGCLYMQTETARRVLEPDDQKGHCLLWEAA